MNYKTNIIRPIYCAFVVTSDELSIGNKHLSGRYSAPIEAFKSFARGLLTAYISLEVIDYTQVNEAYVYNARKLLDLTDRLSIDNIDIYTDTIHTLINNYKIKITKRYKI